MLQRGQRVNLVRGVISQTPAVPSDVQHVLQALLLIHTITNATIARLDTIVSVAPNVCLVQVVNSAWKVTQRAQIVPLNIPQTKDLLNVNLVLYDY